MIRDRPPFSWRADPGVPTFDDGRPVAVMDGACTLCSAGARMIARFDRRGEFAICPNDRPLGRALMTHFGVDPDDPATWLVLIDGRAYGSMDAVIATGRRVGGLGHATRPLALLPRGLRDGLYARVARSRYRVFGRTEICSLPDPRLKARLIG